MTIYLFFYLSIYLSSINDTHYRTHIIDLESSTTIKFSRHLIVRIPYHCFENNIHCGSFVRMMLETTIAEGRLKRKDIARLFVRDSKGKEVFFADLGM